MNSSVCKNSFPNLAKFEPIAYGIKKLQISCVVEDDKVGVIFWILTQLYAVW